MRIKGLTSPFLGDLIFLNASDESEEKMGSEKMKKNIFLKKIVSTLYWLMLLEVKHFALKMDGMLSALLECQEV